MTYNGQTNIRNGFLIWQLVIGVVLHMCIPPKTIKVEFSSWPTAAILDLAIAKFVAGWRASTSVIFYVSGPMNSVQVRNSPNTILQTGLQARSWTNMYINTMSRRVHVGYDQGFLRLSLRPPEADKQHVSCPTCQVIVWIGFEMYVHIHLDRMSSVVGTYQLPYSSLWGRSGR